MAAEEKRYISKTVGEIASAHRYSVRTFWDNFTPMHFHDMIELGYRIGRLKLPPLVVKYIELVVMQQKSREDFEQLSGKSFKA